MLELEHGFRIVDVHARLEPDGPEASARGHAISPDRLERQMHQAGVVRSIVFPGERPGQGYLRANNAVARMCVDRPFVAFARIDGPRSPGSGPTARVRNVAARRAEWHVTPDDVERFGYDDRFHGFSLDPAADGLPDEPVIDRLEDVGLPLLVRGGVAFSPSELAETLLGRGFPVIVAHFGGHPLHRGLMAKTVDLLDRFDECYLDTSAVRYRKPLERALREHPDRVLFGSGAPAVHPNVAVMEILTLDVPEDAMKKAFSKNGERVVAALEPGT